MTRSNFKIFSYLLITVFLTLGLSISFQSLLAAWTAPLANPPTCAPGDPGCDAPINTSWTSQTKGGPLFVNFNNSPVAPYGLAVSGRVGIGTAAPNETLEIASAAGRFITSDGGGADRRALLFVSPTTANDYGRIEAYKYGSGAGGRNLVFNTVGGGNVGIGTTTPGQKLTVAGIIESTTGGFRFPDGSTQITAFVGGTSGWTDDGAIVRLTTAADSVGIGTAAPNNKLEVNGNVTVDAGAASWGEGLNIDSANGTWGGIKWRTVGRALNVGNWHLGYNDVHSTAANSSIYMYSADAAQPYVMTWAQSGNVGIGTASPDAPLHISGASPKIYVGFATTSAGTLGLTTIEPTALTLMIPTGASTLVRGGKILGVYDAVTGYDGLLLQTQNTQYGQTIGANTYANSIDATYANIKFSTMGSEWMRINNLGNVGIGTAAPGDLLHLSYSSNTAFKKLIFSNIGLTAGSDASDREMGSLDFQTNVAARTARVVGYVPAGAGGTDQNAMKFIVSQAGTPSTAMVIRETGNVGIGTTAPLAKLQIGSFSLSFADLSTVGTFAGASSYPLTLVNTTLQAAGNTSLITFTHGPSTWSAVGAMGSVIENTIGALSGLVFYTYNGSLSEKMRIKNDGNVGIGTINPGYKLSVVDTGTTPLVNIWNNSGTSQWTGARLARGGAGDGTEKWFIGMNSADDKLRFRRTASSDDLVIDTGGKVGIGTTTPGYKLDVAGDINYTGVLRLNGTPVSFGGASDWTRNSINGYLYPTALTDNVGIGTVAPGYKLDVNGIFHSTGSVVGTELGGYVTSGAHRAQIVATGTQTPLLIEGGSGVVEMWNAPAPTAAVAFGMAVPGVAVGNDFVFSRYVSGWYEALRILTSNGNVGIGTANPGTNKLKVQGDAEVTGTLTANKLNVSGADVAEEFATTEELAFGTVVVMGDEGVKTAKPCDKKYDKKVIGVVSNNPSIIMGRIADKVKAVIALTGVVKVKVTTENGKIEKGDLLVTSDLRGYAMKATEEKVGTIIGKALENFSGQTGEITALINLQ